MTVPRLTALAVLVSIILASPAAAGSLICVKQPPITVGPVTTPPIEQCVL